MKKLTKYYIKLVLILASIDEWFMSRPLVRLVSWVGFAGTFNTRVVGPLIRMFMDPNPSFWLEMGIMIPLNMSMLYFWDAFHLWFWQAAHRSIDKYLPKQEDSTL